jgi:hypothetical protein
VRDRHVLEARAELLCVDVRDIYRTVPAPGSGAPAASVSVHALEVGDAAGGRTHRWVERERVIGGNVCFFLDCDGFR